MDHQSFQEQISQFMDNELPKEQQQALFRHLSECELCREFFSDTKTIHDTVKELAYDPVPHEMDRKFEVLGMKETASHFRNRTLTISIPTAVYSIGAVIMMTLFMYVVGNIQEKNLSDQFLQSVNISRQQQTISFDVN